MIVPELSIIIVNFNTRELLRECLQSVFQHTRKLDFEVIVVDNNSHDGSSTMVLESFPSVRFIELKENVGFGLGNNIGVEAARGKFIFLLNSDAILLENTPLALILHLRQHPEIACVGPRIVLPNRAPQPKSFGHQPSPWRLLMQSFGLGIMGFRVCEGVDGKLRDVLEMEVGWISGVCMCLRREDYLSVNGFDKRFFMYAEDVALCGQLHKNKGSIVLINRFDVLHYGGASSPDMRSRVRNAVLQQRHILQVSRDDHGLLVGGIVSTLVVAIGQILRLFVALMLLPWRGVDENILLHTSSARLRDLMSQRDSIS